MRPLPLGVELPNQSLVQFQDSSVDRPMKANLVSIIGNLCVASIKGLYQIGPLSPGQNVA